MVYIILANGFEEIEAVAPFDILKRGGADVKYAGVDALEITGAHGITIKADMTVGDVFATSGDIIVIPGGMGGVENMQRSPAVSNLLFWATRTGVLLSAICAGPAVLANLGLLDGVTITCYPGLEDMMGGAICHTDKAVCRSMNVLTARAAGSACEFGFALLEIASDDPEAVEKVRKAIVYEG